MRRRLVGTLAVVALLAGCGGTGTGDEPDDLGTKAWVMCERFIEQRTGQSGDFGGRGDTAISGKGDGPYTVKSTVGGKPYSCAIEHTPDSDEWRLIDLTIAR